MGQALQLPQPQTMDLPCFFFLTIFTMIAATIAMSTAQMMIVHIFCDNHVIRSTPFKAFPSGGRWLGSAESDEGRAFPKQYRIR